MKKIVFCIMALVISATTMAEDHVMAATHGASKPAGDAAPKVLSVSLSEAQDYAVKQNRNLRNASLEVQQAYAQQWQSIAALLPQAERMKLTTSAIC